LGGKDFSVEESFVVGERTSAAYRNGRSVPRPVSSSLGSVSSINAAVATIVDFLSGMNAFLPRPNWSIGMRQSVCTCTIPQLREPAELRTYNDWDELDACARRYRY
jgi:hypothetical protein